MMFISLSRIRSLARGAQPAQRNIFRPPDDHIGKETLLNGLNASIIEFMFDTTRMITNIVATGTKKRFSQIKIISDAMKTS
jgi:hypothetical protein